MLENITKCSKGITNKRYKKSVRRMVATTQNLLEVLCPKIECRRDWYRRRNAHAKDNACPTPVGRNL
jgi:hypothetical protein